ncbi:hypothetical protein E2C01_012245 [Portunus trituberculatus]|uniref:PiggyBac transposable element-derived protein domain-containing protein n=1 Tax=Portunus trituberculatus TaxID=210409 RepID=A0A5B7DDI4_PORTR|nr:hypothetical protein [Portunus trituberculatus]
MTTVALATNLQINCGMTYIATLKVNKEIPLETKDTTYRRPGSSAFLYTNNITLLLYCKDTSRTKKLVHLMSTMHTHLITMPNRKPEIITFLRPKVRSNTFNQMCSYYAVGHKTKRCVSSMG